MAKSKFVVFTVGNCLSDVASSLPRDRIFIHLESNAARARQARQIRAQPVAQVHHGMNRKVLREPARFLYPRRKPQMPAAERSPQPPRHKQFVIRFSSAATDPSILLHETAQADRNRRRAFDIACFTAHDRHPEGPRGLLQSTINFFRPIEGPLPGNNQGDERKLRNAGHRSEIAQRPGHGLPTDRDRRACGPKMDALHDAIGLEQLEVVPLRTSNDRAVIARAQHHRTIT